MGDGATLPPEGSGAALPALAADAPVRPADGRGLAGRLGEVWRTGSALFLAQAVAGGLGAVAWLVAARTHSGQAVGTAIALVGALTWAGLVGNLGLGSTVVGWGHDRPAGDRRAVASTAVVTALVAAGGLALAVAAALQLGHGALGATARHPVAMASLVAGGASWAAGVVLDHVAVTVSRPGVAVERSLVSGAARLAILGGCLLAGNRGAVALVAGWAAATAMGSAVAAVRLRRAGALVSPGGATPGGLALARLGLRTHHFVNLFGQTPPMIVPVAIALRAGGETAAAYGAAWQIAAAVGLLSPAVATGLFAAASADRGGLGERARRTARQVALAVGAGAAVLVVAGGPLLAAVGPDYRASGLVALRLLAVGLVADAVTNVEIARRRVLRDFRGAIGLNALIAAVSVGGAFVLAGREGAAGGAAAWLLAQAVGLAVAWWWSDHGRTRPTNQDRPGEHRPAGGRS